jgi:hypothetical protein
LKEVLTAADAKKHGIKLPESSTPKTGLGAKIGKAITDKIDKTVADNKKVITNKEN